MSVRFTVAASAITRTTGLFASPMSMCFWGRISVVGASATFIDLVDAQPAHFLLGMDSAGTTLQVSDDSALAVNIAAMAVGRWYFVAATAVGTTFTAWMSPVDGGPLGVAVSGTAGLTPGTWTEIMLGSQVFNSAPLNGNMANFKMWNAQLTRDEFMAEQFTLIPIRTDHLNCWHPLLSQDSAAQDFSGNSHNMTLGATILLTEPGPPCSWP